MIHASSSVLLEGVEYHLRIGFGLKNMALLFQLCPQFHKIVYFAIEYDPEGAVFVVERLIACVKVNDAKPAKAQRDAGIAIIPVAVWTAVDQAVRHFRNDPRV
jgi:hypothetical protein